MDSPPSLEALLLGSFLTVIGQWFLARQTRKNLAIQLAHEARMQAARSSDERLCRTIERGIDAARRFQEAAAGMAVRVQILQLGLDDKSEEVDALAAYDLANLILPIEVALVTLPRPLRPPAEAVLNSAGSLCKLLGSSLEFGSDYEQAMIHFAEVRAHFAMSASDWSESLEETDRQS